MEYVAKMSKVLTQMENQNLLKFLQMPIKIIWLKVVMKNAYQIQNVFNSLFAQTKNNHIMEIVSFIDKDVNSNNQQSFLYLFLTLNHGNKRTMNVLVQNWKILSYLMLGKHLRGRKLKTWWLQKKEEWQLQQKREILFHKEPYNLNIQLQFFNQNLKSRKVLSFNQFNGLQLVANKIWIICRLDSIQRPGQDNPIKKNFQDFHHGII